MALSEERKTFIASIANDEWVSGNISDAEFEKEQATWDKNLEEFVNTSNSAEELHEFVAKYNWDKGYDSLTKVINNTHCDLNTVRLAFWLSSADYHQEKYNTREEAKDKYNEEEWDFIQTVIKNAESGKYKKEEMPPEYIDEFPGPVQNPKWEIPAVLYGEAK